MIRNIVLLSALALAIWANPARAEFDLKTYQDMIKHDLTKEKLSDYVTGLGRGVFWANAALQAREQPQLFCMPAKLALDQGLIESLLAQEIRTPISGTPYPGDTPIEMIMLTAFVSRFPCE